MDGVRASPAGFQDPLRRSRRRRRAVPRRRPGLPGAALSQCPGIQVYWPGPVPVPATHTDEGDGRAGRCFFGERRGGGGLLTEMPRGGTDVSVATQADAAPRSTARPPILRSPSKTPCAHRRLSAALGSAIVPSSSAARSMAPLPIVLPSPIPVRESAHDDPVAKLRHDLDSRSTRRFVPSWRAPASTSRASSRSPRRCGRGRQDAPGCAQSYRRRRSAPREDELLRAPEAGLRGSAAGEIGEDALRRGELAFCVMAGGMATRMGGVVKALVEAVAGKTFLDLRLGREPRRERARRPPGPLVADGERADRGPHEGGARKGRTPPSHVQTFLQDMSLRLTQDGRLFRDAAGAAELLLHRPRRPRRCRSPLGPPTRVRRRGRQVRLDREPRQPRGHDRPRAARPVHRVEARPHGRVRREGGGRPGGIPVHAPTPGGAARLQVLEEFRLPRGSTPSRSASSTRTRSSSGPTLLARPSTSLELVRGREEGRWRAPRFSSSGSCRRLPRRSTPPTSVSRVTAPPRVFSRSKD